MITKAAWCYAKDGESRARKDDLVQEPAEKMLRAQKLQEEALAAGEELPKFARDPNRWQGYLKFLGRKLPWQDAWAHDWQEFHASGFHKDMQVRKYSSDDLWYKALLLAIAAGSVRRWRVAETTEPDAIYAINLKFEQALRRIRDSFSVKRMCKPRCASTRTSSSQLWTYFEWSPTKN